MIITIIIIFKLALVAQRIERSPAKAEVGGSIPLKRAIFSLSGCIKLKLFEYLVHLNLNGNSQTIVFKF